MNINAKKAQDKLSQELSAAKLGKYAQAVAKPTLEVLKTFCEQNEEFAQAVLQGCGRSFQYDYRPGRRLGQRRNSKTACQLVT